MKSCILIYEDFAQFEVVLCALLLQRKMPVVTVTHKPGFVTSVEGFKIQPDFLLDELDLAEVEVFLIPGGPVDKLFEHPDLPQTLLKLNSKGTIIGAICAGPVLLGQAGLLRGRRFTANLEEYREYPTLFREASYVHQNVVVDGNLITAKPSGYVDFALEIGKMAKIFKDSEHLQKTIAMFREYEF